MSVYLLLHYNFNPHLRMRGDKLTISSFDAARDFNPHLRMRGDLPADGKSYFVLFISIHTSVWEVT